MSVKVDALIPPTACSPVLMTKAACLAVGFSDRLSNRRISVSRQSWPPLASITSRQPDHTRRYGFDSGIEVMLPPAKSYRANSIEWAMSAEGCELCREDEGREGGSESTRTSITAEDAVRYELNAVDGSVHQSFFSLCISIARSDGKQVLCES